VGGRAANEPHLGVLRYANIGAIKAIIDIAQVHRNVASSHTPPVAALDAADRAARAVAGAISRTSNPAGLYAVRAAYESTAIVDVHHQAALDAVTGNALRAHILASGDSRGKRIVELTRDAIRSWRDLPGLAIPSEQSPRQTDQPDRAAADRALLTYPAHRILLTSVSTETRSLQISVGPLRASVRIADDATEHGHKNLLWVHKIGASTQGPLEGELSKA
jgi:hypothetical protein